MDDGRHAKDYRHGHGGAVHPPASIHWSPMLAGLSARLAVALGLIAVLWFVVAWSLRP